MNGVNILYSFQSQPDYMLICLTILFGVFAIVSMVGGIIIIKHNGCDGTGVGMLCSGAIIVIIVGFALYSQINIPKVTHYKVEVKDTVPFNEFMSKYEIIDNEGFIWEVIEKTSDN